MSTAPNQAAPRPATGVANPILSFSDVKRILFKKITDKGDELVKAFQLFDTSHTLTVSKSELRRIVTTFLLPLTREQFHEVLAQIPLTSSGAVPYLEFLSRFGGIDLNINVTKRFRAWPRERQAAEMRAAWAAESLLAGGTQDTLEDLPGDHPVGPSEDEGSSDGERKHQRLLEAVSSLDGKKRWKGAERSEASLKVSEFTVSSAGSGERLVLSDLLEPIKASPAFAAVEKQLRRVRSRRTVEVPFAHEEAERTRREAAFHATARALSRWDPVVLRNRRAGQQVFPSESEPAACAPVEHALRGWTAGTPLEQDIFALLRRNKQPLRDPLLTPADRASVRAVSQEEARMRRAELQRARALQSYYEARARREKKIKSKKYHRLLKKRKAKKVLEEFEKLQKVDPAATVKDLEKLGMARVLERMSLRHQDSGKWARAKAAVARRDAEARRAVQEQLARNKELTQKLSEAPGSEEEDGDLPVPDVGEAQVTVEGPNPWMVRNPSGDSKEAESRKELQQRLEPVASAAPESEGEGGPEAEEEVLLKEFEERRSLRETSGLSQGAEPEDRQETKDPSRQERLCELRAPPQKPDKDTDQFRKEKVPLVRTVLPAQREGPAREEEPVLPQRPERAGPPEEPGELGKEGCFPNGERPGPAPQREGEPAAQPGACGASGRKEQRISLQNVLAARAPPAKSSAAPATVEEQEGEREPDLRQMVQEAFAGDDVLGDFLEEKRAAAEASALRDAGLRLPGWGEWGGVGLEPRARKRHRFVARAPAGPPRKDKNLPNVIISEKRNIHAAAHQVRALPHPFTHRQQFERTLRTPIGSTWNTQRVFQKLTAPRVVTKPGHIIKPIKAEDVGFRSSAKSDLSVTWRNTKQGSMHHQNAEEER